MGMLAKITEIEKETYCIRCFIRFKKEEQVYINSNTDFVAHSKCMGGEL